MSLLSNFYQNWQNLMDKYSDPRTSEWPLMSSPFPTIWICILYVYCVKVGITTAVIMNFLSKFFMTLKLNKDKLNVILVL